MTCCNASVTKCLNPFVIFYSDDLAMRHGEAKVVIKPAMWHCFSVLNGFLDNVPGFKMKDE